jgi:chaperonin GroES
MTVLRPLGDRLIVRVLGEGDEQVTDGGIVIPDMAREQPNRARVVAVGSGSRGANGEVVPVDVLEGDVVLYSKYGGTSVTHEGEKLLLLREADVLAVEVAEEPS